MKVGDPPSEPQKRDDDIRRRRSEDAKRCRARRRRGAVVVPVEIDAWVFDLMERFVGFTPNQTGDRQRVADALGRLLQMALIALVHSQNKA